MPLCPIDLFAIIAEKSLNSRPLRLKSALSVSGARPLREKMNEMPKKKVFPVLPKKPRQDRAMDFFLES